ncbi:hypothetical protein [Lapidilactobacillus bayanensis]|uniref:hypothetical protein n=1 Tax=Lapidilactobacillus bayanensis TaxID=2485998 RepID=UPI000F77034F|nr:hypothetical protein [Lapidilactobacillus bayanensis]
MADLKQRVQVIGWLAAEDQKMLSETDRFSFFMFFYELLRKNSGLSADFTGFTIESLLGQPQLLDFRDAYRADPEEILTQVKTAYQKNPEKVDKGLATMAYVLSRNNSLDFLQDFVHQFDFWKKWQQFHRPSPLRELSVHDQNQITDYFNRNNQ